MTTTYDIRSLGTVIITNGAGESLEVDMETIIAIADEIKSRVVGSAPNYSVEPPAIVYDGRGY